MNFFEHQDRARRQTALLVFLFIVAVGAIIVAVHFAAGLSLTLAGAPGPVFEIALLDPVIFLVVSAGTIAIVFLGSAYRIASLRSGGTAVATALGGRLVSADAKDAGERRLLNVVEEMAIASGCRVPKVFILENDSGINAFAAGFSPNDAVVGVTRGAIESLSRDELQGVIAHEFSHIFNGDMKLNIRLMGVLFGITMLSTIGYWVFRIFGRAGSGSRRSSSRDSGGGAIIAVFAFALLLMLIGWIGAFFASMIQAALSRQREFLADASAVQFTRNPDGLCRVFRRMLRSKHGAIIESASATEASHMFFGDGVKRWFAASPLATHPPLHSRVERILGPRAASFLGEKEPDRPAAEPERKPKPYSEKEAMRQLGRIAAIAGAGAVAGGGAKEVSIDGAAVTGRVGEVATGQADAARSLIASIPAPLVEAVRSPLGACAVVLLLLLDEEERIREKQIGFLEMNAPPVMAAEFKRLLLHATALAPHQRLPLLDLALPSIKRISPAQYRLLRKSIEWFARADEKLSLFEYALEKILLHRLDPEFGLARPRPASSSTPDSIEEEVRLLLSVLAHMAHVDAAVVRGAFLRGMEAMGLKGEIRPLAECGFDAIDAALERIGGAAPDLKRRLIEAFVETVNADGLVTVEEAEMLRALADSLDCPIPLYAAAA